ncbi:hypothetical protein [Yersinia ruckeri]|uniref:hypothetical protein n=1 Tax=Yersinia ruckeri TaxID=29486 RepID=UPI0020C104F2|nr:hypothetical protein [Yersinia ruckeri]MCK8586403.1 hypothetical protein [Yersinia ruckeri]MCW6615645.1 hypothetical protein [Yersinia ruckeri]
MSTRNQLAEVATKTGLDIETLIQRLSGVISESGNNEYCEAVEKAIAATLLYY